MKVEVHILAFNEREIIPFTLRHYLTIAERIIVHDGGSNDGTRELAARLGAEVHDWDTDGRLNDRLAKELKQSCWHGTDAEFVAVVDADELLYFPVRTEETLQRYFDGNVAVVKPHGWEMFADVFPTHDGQIYDVVKMGARDDKWYAKPVLFQPRLIERIEFTAGAHSAWFWRRCAKQMEWAPSRPSHPPTFLLHCHQLGPIERIAARYDATRRRLSDVNVSNRWGNFDPGLKHAQDKRALIVPRLERVIP